MKTTYTVNSFGQRISRQQSGLAFATATTDAFSYNARGEVTNSTNTLTPSANRAYSYDPIGNRLFATEGSVGIPSTNPTTKTYLSNALNQYTQINTDTPSSQPPQYIASPSYDLDGNMLSDGTGKLYTWDAENRLIQVTLPNNEVVKYFYDSGSRRVKREHITATTPAITTTTLYLYDSWNVIAETTTDTKTSATTSPSTKTYHWGLDLSNTLQSAGGVGGLLRTTYRPPTADDTPSVPQLHYHLYDANGNTSELLDSAAVITAPYEYDPFGKEFLSTGFFALENTYRFSTKPLDAASGLHYYGYRFHDADAGHWMNRDLISETGGFNLYGFLKNETIGSVDYLGLANKYEIWWSIKNRCCCLAAEGIPSDIDAEMARRGHGYHDGSVSNAVYHCAWMCATANLTGGKCSKAVTRQLGNAHEGPHRDPYSDMDRYNNEVGLNMVASSISDCFDQCEEAAWGKTLHWLFPDKPAHPTGAPYKDLPTDPDNLLFPPASPTVPLPPPPPPPPLPPSLPFPSVLPSLFPVWPY